MPIFEIVWLCLRCFIGKSRARVHICHVYIKPSCNCCDYQDYGSLVSFVDILSFNLAELLENF